MSVGRLFTKRPFELISSHVVLWKNIYVYIAVAHTCVCHVGPHTCWANTSKLNRTLTNTMSLNYTRIKTVDSYTWTNELVTHIMYTVYMYVYLIPTYCGDRTWYHGNVECAFAITAFLPEHGRAVRKKTEQSKNGVFKGTVPEVNKFVYYTFLCIYA